MSDHSLVHFKADAKTHSVRTLGRIVFRIRAYIVAAIVGTLPVAYIAAIAAITGLVLLHSHAMVMSVNFNEKFSWQDAQILAFLLLEIGGVVLLIRQVLSPHVPMDGWQEVLPGDQPEFFQTMKLVAEAVGAPVPAKVVVDSTAALSADYSDTFAALFRRGMKIHLGLAVVVGLDAKAMTAALAHELSFYGRGTGSTAARFIRGVHRWFDLRIQHDPWLAWLREKRWQGPITVRAIWWMLWLTVWLSLRPLRILFTLCRILSGTTLKLMVKNADECAARLMGSEVAADMVLRRASTILSWSCAHDRVKNAHGGERLPDNIPLLVARHLMHVEAQFTAETIGTNRSHWIDMAPNDGARLKAIARLGMPGIMEGRGEATDLFRNFHELARRMTYFHYQNDLGKAVNEHMLVPVEETVHDQRRGIETIQVLNKYFKGLAHPERAFCGIAEEQTAMRDPELLRFELLDCREWLDTYGERMASALNDWSATWQLVRDLEMGYLLSKSGMPVPRGQFAMALHTPDAFREEIERHRGIMDNLEGLLRHYEGRLETRLSCALELLWRAELSELPPRLAEIRQTLPHWVLVYEALGLHLPVLRELMTHFHAFQALGASVSGVVDSAAYLMTVQTEIPRMAHLIREIVNTLSQWPYPFKTNFSTEGISLAAFVAPQACEPGALDFDSVTSGAGLSRREAAQNASRRIVQMVTPMMDRYLNLYHQSFAWVTKAADMAEWHFVDPFDPNTQITDLQHRQRAVRHVPEPVYEPEVMVDPELEFAE